MRAVRRLVAVAFAASLLSIGAVVGAADAARPTFGNLYYDDAVVGTVIPPAAAPNEGIDPIYPVVDGVEGQLPVAGVAPGDPDYHGGKWAVSVVTWHADTEPYLLTSEADVFAAELSGDVTITRMSGADFKCPIQPGRGNN